MAVPPPPPDNEVEALQAPGLEWGPQLFGLLLRAQSVVFPATRAISFPRCSFCGVGDLEVLTLKHSAQVLFFA